MVPEKRGASVDVSLLNESLNSQVCGAPEYKHLLKEGLTAEEQLHIVAAWP
jgi:hypothetical protein